MRKHRLLAAATTNATSVKTSAGRIHQLTVHNSAASAKFLKFFDKASAPTVGTDTVIATYPIAAGTTLNLRFEGDLRFDVGIAYGITGAVADNDTTALTANDVVLNMLYQ